MSEETSLATIEPDTMTRASAEAELKARIKARLREAEPYHDPRIRRSAVFVIMHEIAVELLMEQEELIPKATAPD